MATQTKAPVSIYKWEGKNKKGVKQKGELQAANEQLVRVFLQKQGVTPTSIALKPKALWESKGTIKTKDIVTFTRQMATMLKAGMSVSRALALIGEGVQKPVRLREMIENVNEDVSAGTAFSEALAEYPVQFDDLYRSLVKAGEEAGVLDDTMDKIATNLEKGETIKKKVKKAMTYPIMVVIAAIIVTAILLIKVIPVFEGFFADFGAELPALTQFVVGLSRSIRTYGIFILIGVGLLIFAFIWFKKRNKNFARRINIISSKLPLLGPIMIVGANARYSRTLSTLFESGVPLVKGIRATGPATGNVMYEEACEIIADEVSEGQQLNFSMQNTGLFEPFSLQMVSIGEESGNLGEMLGKVADYYEEDLDYKIDNLTTMIEPIIIGFLAIVVGTLVIAMYMPIFMLGDVVG